MAEPKRNAGARTVVVVAILAAAALAPPPAVADGAGNTGRAAAAQPGPTPGGSPRASFAAASAKDDGGRNTLIFAYENAGGEPCRVIDQRVTIDGRETHAVGTMCQQADGQWRLVR